MCGRFTLRSSPPAAAEAFRAYFTEGRDIGDRRTLLDVAAEAGLDRHDAEAVLNRGDQRVAAMR
jgi:predicted DsbA family dithiol-disulfide isomerase